MAGKLNFKAAVASMTIIWGGYVTLLGALTSLGVDNIIWFTSGAVDVLANIYPGFAPTLTGTLIGGLQAAICAAVGMSIFVSLYNTFVSMQGR